MREVKKIASVMQLRNLQFGMLRIRSVRVARSRQTRKLALQVGVLFVFNRMRQDREKRLSPGIGIGSSHAKLTMSL